MQVMILQTRTARIGLFRIPLWLALIVSLPACAHEFWICPASFFLASPKMPASITLRVGENFTGQTVGFSQGLVSRFRHISSAPDIDLDPGVPIDAVATLAIAMPREGTHLLAMDTHPGHIEMPAEKFHAYLRDEGLDQIVLAREAAGKGALPGRERYRRNIKALIQVGKQGDATYARRTGQMLEIVPMANPLQAQVGAEVTFQVVFNSRPLGHALVKFWHERARQNPCIEATTREDGTVTVTFPWPGAWMASVVHMVAAEDSERDDWDSYWGNLTFALPEASR